jgi:hypothetical protein
MPKPHGSADRYLIARAEARGYTISFGQLETWRSTPALLPANQRAYPGGGGSASAMPSEETLALAIWLAEHSRPGVRPLDLALRAFQAGHPVPEPTVRAAFDVASTRGLEVMDTVPAQDGVAAEDRAVKLLDHLAGRGVHTTVLSARIRNIDRRFAAAGLVYTSSELSKLDRGPGWGQEPPTSKDFALAALGMAIGGGAAIAPAQMGDLLRMIQPEGAASPMASNLAYDPGLVITEDGLTVPEAGGLVLVPNSDVRGQFRDLLARTPLERLHRGLQAAAALEDWAHSLCQQVEDALDRRAFDEEPIRQWYMGTGLGLHRVLMRNALAAGRPSWSDRASTATLLLWISQALQALFDAMPEGQWRILDNPDVLPTFLRDLLDFEPQPGT